MAEGSKIEWTDDTWNPVTGCSVVSAGCTNCYAMKLAGGRMQHHPSRKRLTDPSKAGPVWNGKVRFNEDWLDRPLRRRKPRRIFVCAHGDLFHDNVPNQWIDRVFAVMALSPQHSFQVLTKRPERMRAYLSDMPRCMACWGNHATDLLDNYVKAAGRKPGWPLPNVWLGVSVEDQATADERIPVLLDTPAALRFISAEPLLGPVDLWDIRPNRYPPSGWSWNPMKGFKMHYSNSRIVDAPRLDWVIAGGESGPGSRPAHPDWFRKLRDECVREGVPFFFKQWGDYLPAGQQMADGRLWDPSCGSRLRGVKKLTGRMLDGVTHDAMPEGRADG